MTEYREIKGFVKHRVPRAGKIRLGVKKLSKKGSEYPAEVDYFKLDEDLEARDAITSIYGEQPKRLLVCFLSDNPGEILPFSYKAYTSGKSLVCKGDGETAERARIVKDKDGRDVVARDDRGAPQSDQVQCPCDWLKAKRCKALGNLLVVLPEVGPRTYQIDTGSWHTLQNVHNALREFHGLFNGSLRGKLFWLERRAVETHGSGRKETHWPLFLVLPTPEEYAGGLKNVGDLTAAYRSVLEGAPALEAGHDPARLPVGSPLEEEDHVVPAECVVVESEPVVNQNGGCQPDPELSTEPAPQVEPISERGPKVDVLMRDEYRQALKAALVVHRPDVTLTGHEQAVDFLASLDDASFGLIYEGTLHPKAAEPAVTEERAF